MHRIVKWLAQRPRLLCLDNLCHLISRKTKYFLAHEIWILSRLTAKPLRQLIVKYYKMVAFVLTISQKPCKYVAEKGRTNMAVRLETWCNNCGKDRGTYTVPTKAGKHTSPDFRVPKCPECGQELAARTMRFVEDERNEDGAQRSPKPDGTK